MIDHIGMVYSLVRLPFEMQRSGQRAIRLATVRKRQATASATRNVFWIDRVHPHSEKRRTASAAGAKRRGAGRIRDEKGLAQHGRRQT